MLNDFNLHVYATYDPPTNFSSEIKRGYSKKTYTLPNILKTLQNFCTRCLKVKKPHNSYTFNISIKFCVFFTPRLNISTFFINFEPTKTAQNMENFLLNFLWMFIRKNIFSFFVSPNWIKDLDQGQSDHLEQGFSLKKWRVLLDQCNCYWSVQAMNIFSIPRHERAE